MKSNATIRSATQSDLPDVVVLWQEHQEYHAQCDPYFDRSKDANPSFLKFLQENLEDLGLFVAEIDNRLVGFVLAEVFRRPPCFASREYGMIDDLAVTKKCRGRGIAQKLVSQAMNWFSEKGVHRIETRVLMWNSLACSFWQKAGFDPYMECVYKDI